MVPVAARCLIGTVFAIAVLGKLAGPGRWRAFVASLQPLWPRPGRPALAIATVAAEAAAAALLVPAGTARYGLVLAALVLSVFAAVIAVSRRRGVATSCRCFGSAGAELGTRHVVRNLLLVAVALGGLVPGRTATPAGTAFAVAAGVLGATVVVLADDLVDLFGRPTRVAGSR